jgi:hypothetical protein
MYLFPAERFDIFTNVRSGYRKTATVCDRNFARQASIPSILKTGLSHGASSSKP